MYSQDPDEESIGALFARLSDDAKAYGRAEVGYYRTLVAERMGDAKVGLISGGIAAVLALAAVITLLVGLVLSLATLIGPLGATAVVVIFTLGVAAVCARTAAARLSHAFRAPPGGE